MKAYRYHGGVSFSFDEIEMPKAGKGEAVAKVLSASICGTDLRTYRFGSKKLTTPITVGHEGCYEIIEVGKGVDLKVGKRYIAAPAIGCAECKSCRNGRTNMCDNLMTIGFQYSGAFAQYIKFPEPAVKNGYLIEVPDGINSAVASAVEPVACAVNAQSYLKIEQGDNVVIYGAGFLGCVHAELALMQGADNVFIAEISETRRDKAAKFVPKAKVIDSSRADYMDEIKSTVGRAGVDVVITACPAGITHKQGLELLCKNGRISLFGGLPGDKNYHLDSNLIHYKEVSVFGAHASTVEQNKQALDAVMSGKVGISKYITEFALEDIKKAYQALIDETAEKAVLIMR